MSEAAINAVRQYCRLRRRRFDVRTERPGPNGTNHWSVEFFDGAGRVTDRRERGPAIDKDIVRSVIYDLAGRVSAESAGHYANEEERLTTTRYDSLGRVSKVVNPDNSFRSRTYKPAGGYGTETSFDEEGHRTIEHRDGFGTVVQRTQFVDTTSATTTYATGLDLLWISDAYGHWTFQYFDSLGRMHREAHPDRGTWDYEHWEDGQIRRILDNQSPREMTEFTYDSLGRRQTKTTRKDAAGQQVTTWTYDQLRPGYSNRGRLTGMVDAQGTATYDYDLAGRLEKETRTVGPDSYTFKNDYDAGGRTLWRSFPDNDGFGSSTNPIQYDDAGRVSSVPFYLSNATYFADGSLSSWQNVNGTVTTHTPDAVRGWLQSISTTIPAHSQCSSITIPKNQCVIEGCGDDFFCGPGTFQCCQDIPEEVVQDVDYERDLEGRVTEVTSPFQGETWTYQYDSMHRLRSASRGQGFSDNRAYTYNGIGNLLTNSAVPGVYEYLWAHPTTPTNYLPHAVSRIGSRTYTYDRNGNMKTAPGRTFVYDGNGMPESINGTQVRYDGNGRRLRTVSPTVTRTYPSDDYEISGSQITKYLYVADTLIAKKAGNDRFWIHVDALGSLQAITGANGSVQWRQTYEPFGDEKPNALGYMESRGFTGWREDDHGIVDAGARSYDPEIGRFLSPDPALGGSESLLGNPYAYAANDPINAIDPSGAKECRYVPPFVVPVCPEVVVEGKRDPEPEPEADWSGLQRLYSAADQGGPWPHQSFSGMNPEQKYPTFGTGLQMVNSSVTLSFLLRFNREQNSDWGILIPDGTPRGRIFHIDRHRPFGTHVHWRRILNHRRIPKLVYELGKVGSLKIAAKSAGGIGAAYEIGTIVMADQEDRTPMMWRAGGSLVGSTVGGLIGTAIGPEGTVAGSIGGGFAGTYAVDHRWVVLPSGTSIFQGGPIVAIPMGARDWSKPWIQVGFK